MDLLQSPWIPVRDHHGTGDFRLLTYRELLCEPGAWRLSLPRDDLELAALQLLVCLTQALFTPEDDEALFEQLDQPLDPAAFERAIAEVLDWFQLDHPTQPFMQTRGVSAKEVTPIQKLLIGLPEGNNHAFFNAPGEVRALSASIAAIALFHQASNCPSFGGGFQGSLRGGAPITVLVDAADLRLQVWSNVLTRPRLQRLLPGWQPDHARDRPTWVEPIAAQSTIQWNQIGVVRGLLWQPAHVELVATEPGPCDLLGIDAGPRYLGFRKEKFKFTVDGLWPHPHGAVETRAKAGKLEQRFTSFTTTAPAWTRLGELAIARQSAKGEGARPPLTVTQFGALEEDAPLRLLVGGYRNKQASVLERRHELITLGAGWNAVDTRLHQLVELGLRAKGALQNALRFAAQGKQKKGSHHKELPGLGNPALPSIAEQRFYSRTEPMILDTLADPTTFTDWRNARLRYIDRLARDCRPLFAQLTDPYAHNPALIPIIAWSRRILERDLKHLREE
ncbi:type I-E CRISPR-associated protein Cse1/CasA [Marichromatium sp. AB32]|uniref:type I-E CRISPR-associated protein Cse1/CasA n=1 Tax=Marichromatium sp. AB32 TaxID=2483363 RepID=UPI000F40AE20|nr:type I-E CRISPR-associated protein Cse1/CasA [Marichromatium sp. AB32]RNE92311.1 type I-E CRISPR-associated protein Cse1/CasA [Marichromatium sp. AB32]